MTQEKFSKELAQELFNSASPFPVPFDLAWQWVDYSLKENAVKMLKATFTENEDYIVDPFSSSLTKKPQGAGSGSVGRPQINYFISIDCLKLIGMMAKSTEGKKVREYFLDCERELKAINKALDITPTPEKPQTVDNLLSLIVDTGLLKNINDKVTLVNSVDKEDLERIFKDAFKEHSEELEPIFRANYECYTDAENGDPIVYIASLKKAYDELLIVNEKLQKELDKPRTVELHTEDFPFQTPAKQPRKNKIRVTQSSLKGKHK
jgi:phage anti-repressor protein